ncbi:MAG: glycosyltransferase [Bacteroidaceae bacterium]|nr:glycosyltransferase [Bacteroidaceae bacterium]
MKVAYITNSSRNLGGATKALLQLIEKLAEKGVEPIIILPDSNGIYHELKEKGIKVYALEYRMNIYPPLRGIKDLLFFIPRSVGRYYLTRKAASRLAGILKSNGVQLVHANTSVEEIGRLAAEHLKIPHVYHVREYADKDFGMHYIPSKSYIHAKMRGGNTICITKGIQHYHGLDRLRGAKGKSLVVYDGVLPVQDEPQYSDAGTYFLFAGRVEAAKGLDFLLRGYSQYAKSVQSPLPLKIAGGLNRKEYLAELQDYVRVNGLEQSVEFLGPRSDIFDLMRGAKAIIVASSFEGFGFCTAEAMFNGCLVIGRDLTGTNEQFDNGLKMHGKEIGLRYKTTDELARILQEVDTSSDDKYLEMKKRAFATVNTLYTSGHSAQQVYEFYKSILMGRE